MFVPVPDIGVNPSLDWKDYTLVIPAVSVGNVGQLCVDMLLTTLGMGTPVDQPSSSSSNGPSVECRMVGRWHSRYVLPAVANDVFVPKSQASGKLASAVEVFEVSCRRMILIQQRSPVIRDGHSGFATELVQWARACGFRQIVLLTSTHSSTRKDQELIGVDRNTHSGLKDSDWKWMGMIDSSELNPVRPVGHAELYGGEEGTDPELLVAPKNSSSTPSTSTSDAKDNKEKKSTPSSSSSSTSTDTQQVVRVQGGGVTRSLYRVCNDNSTAIPLIGIVWFSNEGGDNTLQGSTCASLLLPFLDRCYSLKAKPVRWIPPPSWKHVYGAPHDPSLYL